MVTEEEILKIIKNNLVISVECNHTPKKLLSNPYLDVKVSLYISGEKYPFSVSNNKIQLN